MEQVYWKLDIAPFDRLLAKFNRKRYVKGESSDVPKENTLSKRVGKVSKKRK